MQIEKTNIINSLHNSFYDLTLKFNRKVQSAWNLIGFLGLNGDAEMALRVNERVSNKTLLQWNKVFEYEHHLGAPSSEIKRNEALKWSFLHFFVHLSKSSRKSSIKPEAGRNAFEIFTHRSIKLQLNIQHLIQKHLFTVSCWSIIRFVCLESFLSWRLCAGFQLKTKNPKKI